MQAVCGLELLQAGENPASAPIDLQDAAAGRYAATWEVTEAGEPPLRVEPWARPFAR